MIYVFVVLVFCCLTTERHDRSYRQNGQFSKEHFGQSGVGWSKHLQDVCSRRSQKDFMIMLKAIDKKNKQLASFQTWEIYNAMKRCSTSLNVNHYNKMISILGYSDYGSVDWLLWDMNTQRIEPDVFTYNTVINVFKNDHSRVQRIWDEMESKGIEPDVVTYSTAINAFKDDHERVQIIWDEMKNKGIKPNVVAVTIMMKIFRNEKTRLSTLFTEMRVLKVNPDIVFYQKMESVFPDNNERIGFYVEFLNSDPNVSDSEKEKIVQDVAGDTAVGTLRNFKNPPNIIKLPLNQIFYGHDEIWDVFGSKNHGYQEKSVHDTIGELRRNEILVSQLWEKLGYIEVMQPKSGGRYYATGGNRRLYCLKQVFNGNMEIEVNKLEFDLPRYKRNVNTKTNGESVKVVKLKQR